MKDIEAENRRLTSALNKIDHLERPTSWKQPQPKNLAISLESRRAGNELYKKNTHDVDTHVESLVCYTKSIAYGLPDSEELGLAYGNRSALLLHLNRHEDCLRDLECALELPNDDLRKAKYLCRKVECEAELGLQEAYTTCEETRILLQRMEASIELKKDLVHKLVNSIVKLETRNSTQLKKRIRLEPDPPIKSSPECPEASDSIEISRNRRCTRHGRFLKSTRDLNPGETLYINKLYVAMPMENKIFSHCSHCLKFAWSGRPCNHCTQAIYCSENCKNEAWIFYHEIECRYIDKAWALGRPGNVGRLLTLRLFIMAFNEAGSLDKLKSNLEEVDKCTDPIEKGFTDGIFASNHKSVYSLVTNDHKKDFEELNKVSEDSAVLLRLLANHTRLLRKYFDGDKKILAQNEDALFVGRLLSHFHHVVLVNAVSIKDIYNFSTTDWNWSVPNEENCTGLYITPYLSLLNHSCFPNAAKCDTGNGTTILYTLRPIAKDEQVYISYGPSYYEMLKKDRDELVKRFHFTCDCIACDKDWPMFMNSINDGIHFSPGSEIQLTTDAHDKCDEITRLLENRDIECTVNIIKELAETITLTMKNCKMPNWRIAHLIANFIAVYNDVYGYVVGVPETCG